MDRLTAMEIFVRVVETGSFSAAGHLLRIGQPAISKAIARLECSLSVKLLTRSTRRLSPTEAGQKFYECAKRVLEDAEEANLAAHDAGVGLTGRLRISAAVAFARIHLLPRLSLFLAQHPHLEMYVVLDDRDVDLVQEGIDVAFRMGGLPDSSFTARRIGRSPRFVVGSLSYFERAGTPRDPADLVNHQFVVYTREGENRVWSFRRCGCEASVVLKGRLKLTAAEGVRMAVLADIGPTIASAWMFAPELESGAVKAVLTEWELPDIELWAVFPNGGIATAKARALVSFVEKSLPSRAKVAEK